MPAPRLGGDTAVISAGICDCLKVAAEAVPDPGRQIYLEAARIRTEAAFSAKIGFVERLVWLGSNHVCVSPARSGACPDL